MAFHEVDFPLPLSRRVSGGPERRTDIVALISGHEERNQLWADSRRRYDAGTGLRAIDDIHTLVTFFEARRGRFHGFRFRDPADHKSCAPTAMPAAIDQAIGIGDGATVAFQLARTYDSGTSDWTRTIAKPVSGSVLIALDGTPQASGFSVDDTTGIVTFDTAPAVGIAITAGFEFDFPVRFDTDRLDIDLDAFAAGSAPHVPLVEVRV